jgi:hypothetical protein
MKMRDHTRPEPRIAQAMLRELDECRGVQSAATKRARELILAIRTLHEAGVWLEPGGLTYKITQFEVRAFTQVNLRSVLGAAEVQRIKDQIGPVVRHRVDVQRVDRPGGASWEFEV